MDYEFEEFPTVAEAPTPVAVLIYDDDRIVARVSLIVVIAFVVVRLGLDRLLAEFPTSASSLRGVIAFPKSSLGRDPLMQAPAPLHDADKHLGRYGLQLRRRAAPVATASSDGASCAALVNDE